MKITSTSKSLDIRKYFLLFVALLILVDLAVALNVPVLRQVLSFIFLTFLPGWLIVLTLRLNNLDLTTKIVLSVGLSVAFLMFFGLLVNSLLLALGYTKPLSTISLLISFNIVSIGLAILACIRNKDFTFSFSNLKLDTREKAFLIVPSLFPLLSVIGTRLMNLTDNNLLLMSLLFLIPAYVIFIAFYHHKVSERIYPLAISFIGISLLLMYALRSNHIIGADIHVAYYWFLQTLDNLHWTTSGTSPLNAVLSISVLPSIYQSFLNIAPEFLFKILYSLITPTLPLIVYLISKKYIGSFYAFLASFFFMSQIMFISAPEHQRTHMAVFFFALAIMVLFQDNLSEFARRTLFIVFTASIILSHYGTTYVVLFVLLLTWIGMQILSQIVTHRKESATLSTESRIARNNSPPLSSPRRSRPVGDTTTIGLRHSQIQPKRGMTTTAVGLFLTMLFFWYSQMTGPSFYSGVHFIRETFVNWQDIFVTETRGGVTQAALGTTLAQARTPQTIEFVVSWLTIIIFTIGIIVTIRRFKEMISIPGFNRTKPNFLLKKLDTEYVLLSVACYTILVFSVILPYVSIGYEISRTYFQMTVILSVFFIIGAVKVSRYLKLRPSWLILVVLIPYFLCTAGLVSQAFGFPRVLTLNSEGPMYVSNYTTDEESYAAKWIGEYRDKRVSLYRNITSRRMLSQGKIPEIESKAFSPEGLAESFKDNQGIHGYIYLSYMRLDTDGLPVEFFDILGEESKIYSNGGVEIFLSAPAE